MLYVNNINSFYLCLTRLDKCFGYLAGQHYFKKKMKVVLILTRAFH